MIKYRQYNNLDSSYVLNKIKIFLEEDIPDGDQTSLGIITSSDYIAAEIQVVEKLIFSGKQVIRHCFDNADVIINVSDGDELMPGDVIGKICGSVRKKFYFGNGDYVMISIRDFETNTLFFEPANQSQKKTNKQIDK